MQWNKLHWKVLKPLSQEDFERYACQGEAKIIVDPHALKQNDC